jgi:hypothetical protein
MKYFALPLLQSKALTQSLYTYEISVKNPLALYNYFSINVLLLPQKTTHPVMGVRCVFKKMVHWFTS